MPHGGPKKGSASASGSIPGARSMVSLRTRVTALETLRLSGQPGFRAGGRLAWVPGARDLLMLFGGPMYMTVGQYLADIGAAYVIIPVITIGLGQVLERTARRDTASSLNGQLT